MVAAEEVLIEPLGGGAGKGGIHGGRRRGKRETAHGADEGFVGDLHRAVLDEGRGAFEGWIAFEIGDEGDACDDAGGRIDPERAFVGRFAVDHAGPGGHCTDIAGSAPCPTPGLSIGLHLLDGRVDFVVRGGLGNFVMEDSHESGGSLLPMAPGGFSMRGITKNDEEIGAEFSPGGEPGNRCSRCRGGAGGDGFFLVAHGDFRLGGTDEVHAQALGVSAADDLLRTVVEVEGGACGKEVGQARQGFDGKFLRGLKKFLLCRRVGWGRGGEFAGRGIEEGRTISEKQQGIGGRGACVELGVQTRESGFREALGELETADFARDLGIGFVRGVVGGEGLFELGDGDAPGCRSGERKAGEESGDEEQTHERAHRRRIADGISELDFPTDWARRNDTPFRRWGAAAAVRRT